MFKEIAEGIALYKKAVKDYLVKCSEIEEREKSSRQKDTRDYCGEIDWPPNDLTWKRKTSAELSGMVKALGLSTEEWKEIWQEIYKEIENQ